MSRRVALALAVAVLVGALGVVTAWADGGSSSASDGGNSVTVGASSSRSSLEQRSWEGENGERRSRVEVTADDVGPSLRFATADISRTERRVPERDDRAVGSDLTGESEAVGVDA